MNKKRIAVLMAVMLLIGVASGATIAWLTHKTPGLVNTFTVGDINIDLYETDKDEPNKQDKDGIEFHVVPGDEITKDPEVAIRKDSEDCYLFVKMVVENNPLIDASDVTKGNLVDWELNMGTEWNFCDMEKGEVTTITDYLGDNTYYFYREFKNDPADNADDQYFTYELIKDNVVNISPYITKEMVDDGLNDKAPSITFSAAAVQSKNLAEDNEETGKTALQNVIEQLPTEFYSGTTATN